MSNHTDAHIHKRFIPPRPPTPPCPECGLSFSIFSRDICSRCIIFVALRPIRRSLFEFQSQVPLRNPRAVKHYYPRVSSGECSPPGTEASGWLVCLAAGPSPATTSTWPEFRPVEGYNSPKVAAQTIVYATAHHCQVKGKRARQWINMEGPCLKHPYAFL